MLNSSFPLSTILNPPQTAQGRSAAPERLQMPFAFAQNADAFDASRPSGAQSASVALSLSPPRSPRPWCDSRLALGHEQQMGLLRQVCEPMARHITCDTAPSAGRAAAMRRYRDKLVPHLTAPLDASLFARFVQLRALLAHAIMECSALPASHFELIHALYCDTVFFVTEGETLAHALMHNTLASETQKLTCLRLLSSLGLNLAQTNPAGDTPALVAARQKQDPYVMLLAIKSWDCAAFVQRDKHDYSVADTLLANPTRHVASFELALSTDGMRLHHQSPQAWRAPLLPLELARHLPAMLAKPIGARDADGAPLFFQ